MYRCNGIGYKSGKNLGGKQDYLVLSCLVPGVSPSRS